PRAGAGRLGRHRARGRCPRSRDPVARAGQPRHPRARLQGGPARHRQVPGRAGRPHPGRCDVTQRLAAEMTTGHQDTPAAAQARRQTRPMTGAEYIESLRDGRAIYLYGEQIKDVTAHPAFANPIRMTARLYDALHDPGRREVLTAPTDTGSDGYTHRFF